MNRHPLLVSALVATLLLGGVLAGCDRSQDISPGASINDPAGSAKMQADAAAGAQKTAQQMGGGR